MSAPAGAYLPWAVATFLAVPVVVAEGLVPIAAVKRSVSLIRGAWGTGLRTTLHFGMIQFLLLLPVIVAAVAGVALLVTGMPAAAAGVALLVAAGVALLALSAVFSAVGSYARAMIYRYATGRPVPGIPGRNARGAFVPRRFGRR